MIYTQIAMFGSAARFIDTGDAIVASEISS
jgi:hypothetical protein